MANAKPVHSKPAKVETPAVDEARTDPRRPELEPEVPAIEGPKPKSVTKVGDTIITDY